ncbi:TPA: MFS transporter [Acinetobacter nosocomialis]|nr:MFS transporter [Acinetobacter nosocomialis]HAV4991535.1 MFS transporter [Acinetobacter nosocomialis]
MLTAEAEADLRGIIRYTRREWGAAQVRRYIAKLEQGIARLAAGEGPFKDMSELFPALRMAHFAVFFIIQLIGQVPAALWVIYGEDRFQWNTATVGLSLAAFGATHAIFQAFVTGPLSSRLGERRTLLFGMAADATGFVLLAFATQGWMVFPILLLLAAGGVGMPALQAMLSNKVSSNKQGALQGTLTSLTNLSSIAGPLGFTALYSATAGAWNGWVWIVGAILYLICLPILRRPFATSL